MEVGCWGIESVLIIRLSIMELSMDHDIFKLSSFLEVSTFREKRFAMD